MTQRGEESYWWAQFVSAVTFVQSIDDRRDALSPRHLSQELQEPKPKTACVKVLLKHTEENESDDD